MSIASTVQRIANGQDLQANVAELQKHRREAIAYLVAIFAEEKEVVLAEDVDGRDAHHDLAGALFLLAREDVEHVVALLQDELQHERMQPAFSLAWALAHLNDRNTLSVLLTAVRHRDSYVRWAASIGLRRLQAPEALGALNAAAADRSSDVRLEAVEALRDQGDASSLPILRKRLQDRYPGIQQMAREAIEAIERRSA